MCWHNYEPGCFHLLFTRYCTCLCRIRMWIVLMPEHWSCHVIVCNHFIPFSRGRGVCCWSQSQLSPGEAGYALDKTPAHWRAEHWSVIIKQDIWMDRQRNYYMAHWSGVMKPFFSKNMSRFYSCSCPDLVCYLSLYVRWCWWWCVFS